MNPPRLEGANCADLPPFVIDKYFGCNAGRETFRASVAKAICSRCVVLEDCQDFALSRVNEASNGIIAGRTASQLRAARAWLRYEHGLTDRPPRPRYKRPTWLPMSDAATDVERQRMADDPDEPAPEC